MVFKRLDFSSCSRFYLIFYEFNFLCYVFNFHDFVVTELEPELEHHLIQLSP